MIDILSKKIIALGEWEEIESLLTTITGESDWSENDVLEVMTYILNQFVKTITWLLLLFFIAIYLNIASDVLIFIALFMPIRRYSGGAHLKSPLACLALSTALPLFAVYLAHNIELGLGATLVLSAIIIALQVKYGAVNTRKMKRKITSNQVKCIGVLLTLINTFFIFYLPISRIAILLQVINILAGLAQQKKEGVQNMKKIFQNLVISMFKWSVKSAKNKTGWFLIGELDTPELLK